MPSIPICRVNFGALALLTLAATACGDDSAAGAGGSGGTGGGDVDASTPDAAMSGAEATGGTCDRDEACDYTCDADCTVECLGAICTTECPEGGCTMDTDFGAHASLDCAGGGCHSDCDNGSVCEVDCPAGGCVVVCDADSTCTVTCADKGTPCTVTCENGGRATCEGNCDITGCDQTCEPDPSYMPEIDPKDFTTVIDNPLMPMLVGSEWVYTSADEVITVTVLDETYMTAIGVKCVVVHDEVRALDTDELIEDTLDWYAQDAGGNVWYMGEDTAEYFHGEVVTKAGSWEAGKDGALPGIVMHGKTPKIGTSYRQEYKTCEAEDMGEIFDVDVSETVPTGSYDGCIRTRDFTPLEAGLNEIKTYCPGVGMVLEQDKATGERVEELTSFTAP